jgi:short-subunit dehydrogenase
VTVTCLMPGATETHFFSSGPTCSDTKVGSQEKADPADVARDGWEAMRKGADHVVPELEEQARGGDDQRGPGQRARRASTASSARAGSAKRQ